MVECDGRRSTVTDGETIAEVDADGAVPSRPHRLTPRSGRRRTAITIDVDTGELAAPLGTIDHLARAVLDLAAAFGGRTVATAEFATRDPELPITFAAREGEPRRARRRRRPVRAVS